MRLLVMGFETRLRRPDCRFQVDRPARTGAVLAACPARPCASESIAVRSSNQGVLGPADAVDLAVHVVCGMVHYARGRGAGMLADLARGKEGQWAIASLAAS